MIKKDTPPGFRIKAWGWNFISDNVEVFFFLETNPVKQTQVYKNDPKFQLPTSNFHLFFHEFSFLFSPGVIFRPIFWGQGVFVCVFGVQELDRNPADDEIFGLYLHRGEYHPPQFS